MRLAVIVATAPLSKRMRALAMSSCALATAAPTASTLLDRAVHQRQHQVEVVDHQVEDHRHVGAARLERRDAGGLDIERRADAAGQRAVRGGEPLQVPDLQHAVAGGGQGGEVVGLGQRGGDRLFHQHVLAGPQRGGGQGVVRLGRGGDDQRVAGLQQGGKVQVGGAGLPADGAGALGVEVVHADQAGARRRRGLQRVVAAEMAGAGDADAEAVRGHGRFVWASRGAAQAPGARSSGSGSVFARMLNWL